MAKLRWNGMMGYSRLKTELPACLMCSAVWLFGGRGRATTGVRQSIELMNSRARSSAVVLLFVDIFIPSPVFLMMTTHAIHSALAALLRPTTAPDPGSHGFSLEATHPLSTCPTRSLLSVRTLLFTRYSRLRTSGRTPFRG
jgi:hypothetical protein